MTHLPYVAASYLLVLAAILILTGQLVLRLRKANARLALLERRAPIRGNGS